jgi:hypothetical protein
VGRLATEHDDSGKAGGDDEEDADEDRGQATSITMNPMALLDQLDQQVARNSGRIDRAAPLGTQTGTGGPAPLPAPPTGPQKAVVGARQSGKFPDLPNLPTVVAPDAVEAGARPLMSGPLSSIGPAQHDPAQAPTAIGGPIVSEAALKRTEFDMKAQPSPDARVETHGAMSSTHYAVRASQMQNAQNATQPESAISPYGGSGGGAAPLAGYPVMPGGQRPFSSDLAPSGPGSGGFRSPYDQSIDPAGAANLMSPVGEHYPQTDWDRAAAVTAVAMPPWKLAALFVLVVGGALALTLVIAKIFA